MNLMRILLPLLATCWCCFFSSACGLEGPGSEQLQSTAASISVPTDSTELPNWIPADSTELVHILTGRFDPAADTQFVALDEPYTDGDGTYLLRRETAVAVRRMIDSARADSIRLQVRSATRNFERQKQIWEAKWTGRRTLSNGINLGTSKMSDSAKARMILLYSSMPGTSRHHWGTDVDFNAFENDYFETGRGKQEYDWLKANAASFGFYQPYTNKAAGRTGYEEERWHWSYQPIAGELTRLYQEKLDLSAIRGFAGAENAAALDVINAYVLGINPEMLKDEQPTLQVD